MGDGQKCHKSNPTHYVMIIVIETPSLLLNLILFCIKNPTPPAFGMLGWHSNVYQDISVFWRLSCSNFYFISERPIIENSWPNSETILTNWSLLAPRLQIFMSYRSLRPPSSKNIAESRSICCIKHTEVSPFRVFCIIAYDWILFLFYYQRMPTGQNLRIPVLQVSRFFPSPVFFARETCSKFIQHEKIDKNSKLIFPPNIIKSWGSHGRLCTCPNFFFQQNSGVNLKNSCSI